MLKLDIAFNKFFLKTRTLVSNKLALLIEGKDDIITEWDQFPKSNLPAETVTNMNSLVSTITTNVQMQDPNDPMSSVLMPLNMLAVLDLMAMRPMMIGMFERNIKMALFDITNYLIGQEPMPAEACITETLAKFEPIYKPAVTDLLNKITEASADVPNNLLSFEAEVNSLKIDFVAFTTMMQNCADYPSQDQGNCLNEMVIDWFYFFDLNSSD